MPTFTWVVLPLPEADELLESDDEDPHPAAPAAVTTAIASPRMRRRMGLLLTESDWGRFAAHKCAPNQVS
ncbi:hypothetical protein ABZ848_00540 [Streptomyces sp. NPDC047081]|uniref:hypothetical protein n=1 Tax=Streptomyces sp. NPDC047081 TaxID=3154706 RepID=UPI0033CB02DA